MTNNSSLVFPNITAEQYARLSEKARSAGIEMSGTSGLAGKMGVEVEWNYDSQKQELTLTCLHAPFFMTADQVNARLKSIVNESLNA